MREGALSGTDFSLWGFVGTREIAPSPNPTG